MGGEWGWDIFVPLCTKLALVVFSGKIKKKQHHYHCMSNWSSHLLDSKNELFFFFILAHYNYFVTSTEAVACSKSLPIQVPGSILQWVESSKLQRTNGTLGPLPLAGMVTNLVVGQELCQLQEQKKPTWSNWVWQYFTVWRIWTVIWSQDYFPWCCLYVTKVCRQCKQYSLS